MNILILFSESFPVGLAGTNRIITIAQSLIESGNKVRILCITPTEKDLKINNQVKGVYNKISFEYTSKTVIWPKSIIKKLYLTIKGIMRAKREIRKTLKDDKVDLIISSVTEMKTSNHILSRIKKSNNIPVIFAVDEYPWVILRPERYSRSYREKYLKNFYKYFDGMIVMTNTLLSYYKNIAHNNCQFFLMPMTVEIERFNNMKNDDASEEYIAYCGNLGHNNKDGVDILINSFYRIHNKYPNIKLYIIGDTNKKDSSEYIKLKELAKSLGIDDYVVFKGRVHRDKIPSLLYNAKILVLSRPDNLQAQGGFPTKLGEYLVTGKPVVVTDVGEIHYYLKDGINAYIAKPNDIKSFSNKLLEVLNDYNKASEIGLRGREVALKYFDYRNYNHQLNEFLSKAKLNTKREK